MGSRGRCEIPGCHLHSIVVSAALKDANTGLALGVVLAMTVKPGLTGALVMLVLGAAAGAHLGLSHVKSATSMRRISQAA